MNENDLLKNSTRIKISKIYNIVLFVYTILFSVANTIIGFYFDRQIERMECMVGILLVVCFIVHFSMTKKYSKIIWVKQNVFIFAYFFIRLITIFKMGFDYSIIRTVCFEFVYLIAISNIAVDFNFCKRYVFKYFIIINFVFNILNICVYGWYNYLSSSENTTDFSFVYFVREHTCTVITELPFSTMYANPNFMGMMTGIALILSINYISHDSKVSKKIIYAGYLIFSLYCVWLSNCSNAYLGLIVVICAYLLLKVVHIIDKKQLVVICLICCCLVTGILYGFLSSQQENAEFTDFETQLNTYSSSRYAIWKDSYYSHKENMLFGVGNIKLEKQERYQYMLDKGIDEGYDINSSMEQMAGTHNGYVGMISCTGILGLLFFVLGLWRKIIHAEILNDGFWYLAVIFILMLNLFECMFVLSFNFSCLMLFIVLALNNNCADHNKQPQSEVSK